MTRPAPKHAPRVPFALLVLGLLIGGLVMLLALNTAAAANQVRRHALADQDAAISNQLEELRNAVARSQAPANLERVAAQLGMVPAGNPAFLQIGANGTVRVLGSPAPATGIALPAAVVVHAKTTAATRSATATATKSAQPGKAGASKSAGATRAASSSSAATSSSTAKPTGGHRTRRHHQPSPGPSTPATETTTLPGGTR